MTVPLPPITLTGGTILSDEVYSRIGDAILDGTLPAGTRLRDVELAAQLGVSRTPVREALQRLERFGVVEVAVGRYTRVSAPNERLRADTAAFTAYFMGNALRLALTHCSDDELAVITSDADAVLEAARSEDALRLFERSTEMFERVTRATGNSMFIAVIREAAYAIQRNLHGWHPFVASPLTHIGCYERLRDSVATRDADAAESALRRLHGLA